MNKTMKENILECIARYSDGSEKMIREHCTTIALSQELVISRSLASQYLNELVREKKLIKINERPVLFINRFVAEQMAGHKFAEEGFDDFSDFRNKIKNKQKNFRKAVGFDRSLKECICRVKMAINYPGKGLPVIIYGNPGCGKSFLAELIKEYLLDKEEITEEQCMIIHKNLIKNSEDGYFERKLFGEVERIDNGKVAIRKGAIESVESGLLILDDIEDLNVQCQGMLIQYLDTGDYSRIGMPGKTLHGKAKIVLITSRSPQQIFEEHFLSRFPVIVEIPDLKNRTLQEKIELIIYFLKQEALKSGMQIKISKEAVYDLVEQCASMEVFTLQQKVKTILANKLQDTDSIIQIVSKDVNHDSIYIRGQEEPEFLDSFINEDSKKLEEFALEIVNCYSSLQEKKTDVWKERLLDVHRRLNDYVVFQFEYIEKELKIIEKNIQNIAEHLRIQYNLDLDSYVQKLFARYCYIDSYMIYHPLSQIYEFHNEMDELKNIFPVEIKFLHDISEVARQVYDIKFSSLFQIMAVLDLNLYNKVMMAKPTLALVICHGSSTASSMANVANTVLQEHIFDSIDMPFDTDFQNIVQIVQEYLKNKKKADNLLIAVDTGSLTDIAGSLTNISKFNLGVINNVSTGLLLDIGSKIQQNMKMEDLLENASRTNVCTYHFISCKKKGKAILFIGENGIDMADQMKELFERNMPKATELKFISCDYASLKKEKLNHFLFQEYDIIFMEGIFNPEIPEIPFFLLGEIVNFDVKKEMGECLSPYLTPQELEQFYQNLVTNFSLENLVDSLTILNPTKLLNAVVEAVKEMSLRTKCTFHEHTLIGLYVHTCCFVERMVTKTPIVTYPNLSDFQSEKQHFIEIVNESFQKLKMQYHIQIPDSEVGYIYDYVKEDLI